MARAGACIGLDVRDMVDDGTRGDDGSSVGVIVGDGVEMGPFDVVKNVAEHTVLFIGGDVLNMRNALGE